MEDDIPAALLAIDAAAIVSETDAVHSHSSCDEDEGWLSSRHHRSRRCLVAAQSTSTIHESSRRDDDDDEDDDGDADMNDEAELPDDLYCENMDDEDEAWVYKHMRSGSEELVRVRQQLRNDPANANDDRADGAKNDDQRNPKKIKGFTTRAAGQADVNRESSTSQQTDNVGAQSNVRNPKSEKSGRDDGQESSGEGEPSISHNPKLKQALLLKPRTSDAILSCPRCFNTVCMDCQQHERYANQFRAMFVMNIGVDWNKRMLYDDAVGGLKIVDSTSIAGTAGGRIELEENEGNYATAPDRIPHEDIHDHTASLSSNDDESTALYYSVHCSYCQWEVAALDMTDEVYYFYGCIASA